MTEETVREPEMGLTFEKVWAMFQETDRRFKETDRKLEETDRLIKETGLQMKETDRQMKETDRKIGRLGGRLGDVVEHLIIPNILEKFKNRGYVFGKAAPNVRYTGADGAYIAEVDILLENGDTALAVEVKTSLTDDDVRDHAARMEKLRCYADAHQDKRKLLGAVAGAIISEGVKTFAVRNGFFVLEQSGDTVRVSVPEDFKPREW